VVVDQILNNPVIKEEYRRLRGPGTVQERAQWLTTLRNSVESMTATPEARKLLMSGRELTDKMVEKAIPMVPDRFPIFGPDFHLDLSKHRIDTFFHRTLDLPDQVMARVPMAVGLYHTNVEELLPQYIERAQGQGRTRLSEAELYKIHAQAKGMAMNDVRRDMYDATEGIGQHGALQMMSPFFAPWKDAMQSWGRLIYDNPAIGGLMLRIGQTPDMFGITTDAE